MADRPPKPKAHYVVTVYANPGETPRFIVNLRVFEWWGRKGTFYEKTAETMVGGIIYDDAEVAMAVRDQLNSELT